MLDKCVPDAYKKWSTLLGGFLIQFTMGTLYSLGNITPYMISYLREYKKIDIRYADGVFLTTPLGLLIACVNVISGILISRKIIKTRLSIFIGVILMSLGAGLTYFTIQKSFPLTILTFSVMFATGFGFSYIATLSIGLKWFVESRGKASSFILFGLGSGSIVFNQIETYYINPDNYSPDKPYSNKYPDEKYFSQIDLLERVPKCLLILTAIYLVCQIVGFVMLFDKDDYLDKNSDRENLVEEDLNSQLDIINDTIEKEEETNSLGVKYKNINEGMIVKEAVKQRSFYILSIIVCFFNLGPMLMTGNYKLFGQTFIQNDKFLALIGSISSVFNASGRIFWGYLIDRMPFKLVFLIYCTFCMSLVSTAYLNKFIGVKEIYMLWVCFIHFFQTAVNVTIPVVVVRTFGQKNFNAIFGLISLSLVPGSFLAGAIGSVYYKIGWFYLFLIGYSFLLIAFIVGFLFNVKKSNGQDDV